MIRKIAALVMALILMAAFYLYALLQEDEESKRSDQWVVAGESRLSPQQDVISTDPVALARAMEMPLLLPGSLNAGSVKDAAYRGSPVRVLEAAGGGVSLWGVRPASAAAMIREADLRFESTDKTLMNAPLMRAQKGGSAYYYLADDKAAFIIRLPLSDREEETLSALKLANP